MRGWTVILRKELYGFFSSPVAYVVLAVFLVILGFFFFSAVTCFSLLSSEAQQNPDIPQGALNFTEFVWSTLFLNAGVVLLFMTPILTMRAFSEEAKQGTLELILTYPLSEGGIIFGKFAALCFVFLLMVLFTSVFVALSLWAGAGLDAGVLLSGYIGLMLLGMAFISLGIFISSLTENQAVSASLSFGVLLLFW
ncbi:MAG: ABC transporter permease, partial [Candidatus Omnitrophica bacterium]|nr:ABC transporter permease [Candidatus Omnitrophota bacterium]